MATYYPRARVLLQVLLDDLVDGAGQAAAYEVIPRSVDVERNNVREADTATIELDYRDLPIDPRGVRSILVAIFMGDTGGPDRELDLDADAFRAFIGFVDEPETTLEAGGDTVRLTARDYTSLFLDQPWSGASVDLRGSLSQIVKAIVAATPGTDDLAVSMPTGVDDANLAAVTGRTSWTPKNAKDDTWSVLSDLCGLLGLIPTIDRDQLRIIEPARVADGKAVMVYGENVERLSYSRRLNEVKSYQVLVRAWDEQARTAREALYPREAKVIRRKISKKGKVTETAAPILPFYVSGSYTEAQLEDIARRAWVDVVRSQIEGELSTRELYDLDDGALWTLGNGDLLTLTLGRAAPSMLATLSESEAVAALTAPRHGLTSEVARLLVRSARQAEAQVTTFYVLSAKHSWSREDGYQLQITFSSYAGGE